MPLSKSIFPMVNPRQLARRLALEYDETLPSFFERTGFRHKTALANVLTRMGLFDYDNQKNLPGYGVDLSDSQVRTVAFVTGLSEEDIRRALLSSFSPALFDIKKVMPDGPGSFIGAKAAPMWIYFNGSHFCPECLRESEGVWKRRWKLPWSFACVKHQCLLYDTCPQCSRRPRAGFRDNRVYPAFHGQMPYPKRCNNALAEGQSGRGRAGNPCGCELSLLAPREACKAVIELQRRVDVELGRLERADGAIFQISEYFSELRSVSGLVLYRSEKEDFPSLQAEIDRSISIHVERRNHAAEMRREMADGRKGPRPRMMYGVPKDAALMAGVIHRSIEIVEAGSDAELKTLLNPLADRVRANCGSYRWEVISYFGFSTRLELALSDCIASRGNFDRRVGAKSSWSELQSGHGFTANHIPQLFFLEEFETRFKPFFGPMRESFARQFCSVAAVKLLGGTWADAGRALELPEPVDRQSNHAISTLGREGTYEPFSSELQEWAADFKDRPGKVDWRRRREQLLEFVDFGWEEWNAICDSSRFGPGQRGSRSRYFAAWAWADATSGDWMLSPGFENNKVPSSIRDVYGRFVTMLDPALTKALRAAVQARLNG